MSGLGAMDWWSSLNHGGVLIGPSALKSHFPEPVPALKDWQTERLRRAVSRWESGAEDGERILLATLLETACGFEEKDDCHWLRGSQVPAEWTRRSVTGEALKPRWLWQGPNGSRFPVFVDSDVKKLGIGRGRRSVSRVLEWLRATGEPLALVTNYRQWRVIYAGLDFHAWAQSETDLWFEAGQPGPQMVALRTLLSPATLIAEEEGQPSQLLAAIQDSRKGQAELSAVLGERVRQAVEQLIDAHGQALNALVEEGATTPREIYLAATRVMMRLVVVLFAEARDLLPRDNPIYYGSYSLEGLRDGMIRIGGESARARLRQRFGAWPRILALFRLVHQGSHHKDLQVPRYGGELFAAGEAATKDAIACALAVFEDPEHGPDDALVHRILHLLTRSKVKVRQGRRSTWIETAVDFANLSSEYIGILYEGLLDFELRRSDPDDPMVFLSLGKEPALPLSRLESMDDKALKKLLESVKKDKDESVAEELDEEAMEAAEESADEEAEEVEEADSDDETAADDQETEADDLHQQAWNRALAWARHAAEAGKLVRKPRGRVPTENSKHQQCLDQAARGLIRRVVVPGEWFLVRWGGTRKGRGTFYTRPQLAVPTVHRTLRPLACTPPKDAPDDYQVELLPSEQWRPRKPEEILALKVCDPAMGSGSFLVGALRYLTDMLFDSLFEHGRIREEGDKTLIALLEGDGEEGRLTDERLPGRPDDEHFEDRLRARLKRYVVERCIYGVDIDPLAVELARLALWVETLDRDLPFEFLDHKLKVGNSLVGTWFDQFHDYPIMAWEREGGDKTHSTGVHHKKESLTKAIKAFRNELKPELADWIMGQHGLFETVAGKDPGALHDQALRALEEIHQLAPHEVNEKAEAYRIGIEANSALRRLKEAMDAWCAIWFWPADRLDCAPRPKTLDRLSDEARELVTALAHEYRFFHWELEFPDVFNCRVAGFDAMLGNPPWDTLQPNSKEYFSNLDPLYRGYSKQEALAQQRTLFERDSEEERAWLLYNAQFKSLANWLKHAANPFGDPKEGGKFSIARGKAGEQLHERWSDRRIQSKGYAYPEHPFRHQGEGKPYTYKMFLESSHALLREHGQLGMIVPSGVYTDKGTAALRELFVTRSAWRWLFGFENRDKVFDIDSRFKFAPVIVEKGSETDAILTAFMHRDLTDWERAERHVIPYPRAQIEKFSPWSRAILEIRGQRDLEVLDKIYSNAVLLGDDSHDGWGIKYQQGDFNMTSDSHLFKPRTWWEERGYQPDEYGRWIGPDRGMALPLYEGRMVGQFDFSQKGWVRGKGRSAVWRNISWEEKQLEPQYLIPESTAEEEIGPRCKNLRVVIMDIASATNARTMYAAPIARALAGHSAPVLYCGRGDIADNLIFLAVINSFAFDSALRVRMGGLHLTWHYLEEMPLPIKPKLEISKLLVKFGSAISMPNHRFAPEWSFIGGHFDPQIRERRWQETWALTRHERIRCAAIIDAVFASLFGLANKNINALMEGCDHPAGELPDSLNQKGFWRIDKETVPELRQTILTLVAFRDLQAMIKTHSGDRDKGIDAFCNQNDGEGWMLPETLCLADLGLGHDERAKHPQPVRERLGQRFYDWQLEQSVEESWAECERHARNILGEAGFERLLAADSGQEGCTPAVKVSEPKQSYRAEQRQSRLFD